MNDAPALAELAVLPVKNTVLFPQMVMPLSVSRPGSVAAIERAMATEEKQLVIVAQRDASIDEPKQSDLFAVGTTGIVRRMARNDQQVELIVQGIERVGILEIREEKQALVAHLGPLPAPTGDGPEVEALQRTVLEQVNRMQQIVQPQGEFNLLQILAQVSDPLNQVYLLASMLSLPLEKEQGILESNDREHALRLMHEALVHELQVLELRQKISESAASEMGREQREYMLRQQMRAIQEELGEEGGDQAEIADLRERLAKSELPDEVRREAERELARLQRMPPAAPDHQLSRSYLELILELPWRAATEDNLDLVRARQIMDEDHYGLRDVKERIIEHLAVLKLNPGAKAPILCFVGPPGVGKTSLGASIARALGRKFERQSLGGLHDEAELRGHRRTYIGAMPGRILQAVRRAGVNNPLLMLDEIDKLGRDFRGDPAAALLEILDPAQNSAFHDNFLNLPFDLSKVFFITTANTLDTIPQPLLDRMELIRLSGYTDEEKLEIAKRYLAPRQFAQTGLSAGQMQIPDATIARIIRRYTREAGVRNLERNLGRVARKAAVAFAEGRTEAMTVGPDDLVELLGPERTFAEQTRETLPAGVSTGLAWTEAGGDVLYIEAVLLPSGSGLTLTGQLGDVMKESAQAAHSYVWSQVDKLGVDPTKFRESGVHVHVPAGAIPKDGPSAGITIATAIASLFTDRPVRSDTAMTGELTLTGLVLPIGGVKEKVLAARRAGLKRVILPKENEKDLRDLPDEARREIEFVFARRLEEVLAAAIPDLAASVRKSA